MGVFDRKLRLGVLATTSRPTESDDSIDGASDDSFPASDPPSWTGTIAEVAEEA